MDAGHGKDTEPDGQRIVCFMIPAVSASFMC